MEAAALVARPPGVRVTLFDDDSSRRRRATRPVFLVFSRLLASTLGSGCAGAALESKENLYADGQSLVKGNPNLFLGSLQHGCAVSLLSKTLSLPDLDLDGQGRDGCLRLCFGLLGFAAAGIRRALDHADAGKGSLDFSESYQADTRALICLGMELPDALQDIIARKLWGAAHAHNAGWAVRGPIAVDAAEARKALLGL